ncbi:MAG: tetratricopeptide repeat protein [Haliscomenobacter sp.]|nr:tetratricopeptide repeat protein [Haliscomenobacter sp.]
MGKPKKKPPVPTVALPTPSANGKGPFPLPAGYTRRLALILFFFSFLLYANTLGHEYAQDDAIVITDNMFTTQGIKGIPGILQYDTFYGFFKEPGKARLVAGGRYRPFSLVTFALEVQAFGQSPFVGHLFNALLYGATAVLFFLTLLLFFPPGKFGLSAWYTCFGAALLFAAHPIHTEAVANIKGRDEILALLGSLAALYFALRSTRDQRPFLHLAGAACLFLGLMSKENAITFLALVPLALYYFTKSDIRSILKSTLPYAAAVVLFLLIRGSVLGWKLGEPPMEFMNNPYLKWAGNQYIPYTAAERFSTAVYTLGRYLQLLVLPYPLTHDYYPKHIDLVKPSDFRFLLSFFLHLGLLVYAVWGLRKKTPLSFAVWLYLIPLSIVSNLVFPIGTHMAERLLFMPSTGFALAAAIMILPFKKREKPRQNLLVAILIGIAFLFGLRTVARNPVWKNNYTLFISDIAISGNSAKLRNAVAGELVVQSEREPDSLRKIDMLNEAKGHAQKAIELHPTYTNAYLIKGNAHFYLKEYDLAIQAYRQALAINPEYKEALQNLPLALRDGGRYFGEVEGNLSKAIDYLKAAETYQPNDYETLRLLGVAHGVGQQHALAIDYFTRAARLRPEIADAWLNLSTACFASGNAAQGQAYLDKARSIDPNVGQR